MTEVSRIPVNVPVTASESLQEGYLVKKDTGNTVTIATTVDDAVFGVVDQTPTDGEATARTTNSGERIGIFPMGCGKIVNVASVSGDTYTLNDAVYMGQTADTDGYCSNDSSNSATKIGHCMEAVTTASAGELIQVILDVDGSA